MITVQADGKHLYEEGGWIDRTDGWMDGMG